ncbi:hypothetical protein D9I37_02640 [Escherichia coli]|nr:hypothetical protein [Escherichia coli]EFA4949731.1 hypothetical protein [Escherichia coli]MIA78732.1 hypothetical protein [Escherichia coli]
MPDATLTRLIRSTREHNPRSDKAFTPHPTRIAGAAKAQKVDGVEYFFSAIFIDAREGNPYANVFFFC